MRKGFFITLEGVEGCGKSIQARRLEEWLRGREYDVTVTSEPGATHLGKSLRRLLLDESRPVAPEAELFLFAADRAQHVSQVIRPAVLEGKVVISDRFMDSTASYQGFARGLGLDMVATINSMAVGDMTPDITFLIDLDPELGFERIRKSRPGLDRMEREKMEFHMKVRRGYLEIAGLDPDRVKVIDGDRDPGSIFNDIIGLLSGRLP